MTEDKKTTAAMEVVALIYKHSWEATGKSFVRLNNALRRALAAAIEAGLYFDETDFAEIYRRFKGGYWFTADTGGEWFYREAIEANNISACNSFETWKNRKPFIFEGQRMYQGRQFLWTGKDGKNYVVICTSFGESGDYFNACHYERTWANGSYNGGEGKPKKRFKITWDDLQGKRETKKAQKRKAGVVE